MKGKILCQEKAKTLINEKNRVDDRYNQNLINNKAKCRYTDYYSVDDQ